MVYLAYVETKSKKWKERKIRYFYLKVYFRLVLSNVFAHSSQINCISNILSSLLYFVLQILFQVSLILYFNATVHLLNLAPYAHLTIMGFIYLLIMTVNMDYNWSCDFPWVFPPPQNYLYNTIFTVSIFSLWSVCHSTCELKMSTCSIKLIWINLSSFIGPTIANNAID